ncbi:MAG: helix-turn-helix transcriptional regulator [Porticoccaceae bacterium]|nr:helix-turn-helix transcriptional regulator [Porticoccaceae bacterium]
MKLESVLSRQSIETSATIDYSIFINERQESKAKNSASCEIINIETNKDPVSKNPCFSEFDKFIASLEEDQETAKQLSEARKWVADSFYSDQLTFASLRLAAGLSQRELGEACGIEQSHVSRYESGKHEPSMSLSVKMAMALGVTVDILSEAWNNSRKLNQSEADHD